MANKKLISPFERMGTHVYGDRFVGRKELVRALQRNCTSQNFSIQGLPKIGKTSLAYHSVIYGEQYVVSDKPLSTIFFTSIGVSENYQEVFKSLAKVVYKHALDKLDNENAKKRIREHYQLLKEDDFDSNAIQDFFQYGISSLNINFVIIFDEFDKVRKIGFHGPQFALLRVILSLPNVHGIITSKRSIRTLEQWCEDSEGGPSNLYSLFLGDNTIHLQPFDDESLDAYWERLSPYYDEIGLTLDEKYKRGAIYYAGHHPHMLDVYNSHIYNHWLQKHEMPNELSLRTVMEDVFNSNEDILKNEGLLDTAIEVVIGPVYDINKQDLDRLKEYGFIRPTTPSQKRSLMGVELGFVCVDDQQEKAYLCPSDYYSLIMKNHYVNNAPFWQEWRDTFSALRNLAEDFFKKRLGAAWEYDTNSEFSDYLNEMRDLRIKDEHNNIPPSPLIDYLLESKLKLLFSNYWSEFSQVFNPMTSGEFKRKLSFIIMIRNHHAHTSELHISDENKEKANKYLMEIREKVDQWLTKNQNGELITSSHTNNIEQCIPENVKNSTSIPSDEFIRTCYGIFKEHNNKVKDDYTGYSCEVRSKEDKDILDGAKVEYDLYMAKSDETFRHYYYAINVRLRK